MFLKYVHAAVKNAQPLAVLNISGSMLKNLISQDDSGASSKGY
jgi:hypothetical protein